MFEIFLLKFSLNKYWLIYSTAFYRDDESIPGSPDPLIYEIRNRIQTLKKFRSVPDPYKKNRSGPHPNTWSWNFDKPAYLRVAGTPQLWAIRSNRKRKSLPSTLINSFFFSSLKNTKM